MPTARAGLTTGVALALVLLAFFARGGPPAAQAVTYVVDTTADNAALKACTAAPNDCSLRGAVITANASNIFPDTITLPAGTYFVGGAAGEDAAASGDLDIRSPNIADTVSAPLTINGAGAASTIIDAGQSDRVFDMATITRPTNTTTLNLNNLTIRNGYPGAANGGALFLATGDTANLTNVIVSDSVSGLSGGGISSSGNVTLNNSTVIGNSAASSGGGIINGQPGHLTINNSTISGNFAGSSGGGGIVNSSVQIPAPQAALTNVTVSGNSSTGPGGAIHNSGLGTSAVSLTNATLALNSASTGAGINNGTSDTTTVRNSIFANSGTNCSGAMTSQGHNLDSGPSCAFAGPGDLSNIDPLLGLLADNGGPTQTQSIAPPSPAINNGGAGCPSTDQRGAGRVGVCDIGSFEYGGTVGATPTPTPTPAPTPTPVPTPPPTPTPTSPPPSGGIAGDVDCSGVVGAVDALKILRWVAGLPISQNDPCTNPGDPMTTGGNPYLQGNVDCSGGGNPVSAVDALKILRRLAVLPISLPQGCPAIGSPV